MIPNSVSALSKEQRRLLETATLQYARHLDVAEEWLAGRGLDLEFARSEGLGVVTEPLDGHGHLRGRLAIPYLTDYGPVNITFRCMQNHICKEIPDHSKYAFLSGFKTNMYGVQSIDQAEDWIVMTEGEIDRLTWVQLGVPALGISGAKKWQDHWPLILEDFSTVYFVQDGDADGKLLYEKVSYKVDQAKTQVIRIKMPDGEDTNSMYLKRGKGYLMERLGK